MGGNAGPAAGGPRRPDALQQLRAERRAAASASASARPRRPRPGDRGGHLAAWASPPGSEGEGEGAEVGSRRREGKHGRPAPGWDPERGPSRPRPPTRQNEPRRHAKPWQLGGAWNFTEVVLVLGDAKGA